MENMTVEGAAKKSPTVDSKSAIATLSVVASGGLAILKFLVGLLTGSLGLLAEAAHSLLDFVSTLITLVVVRVAAVPPDQNHPYGHERAENLGALAGMTLLVSTRLSGGLLTCTVRPGPPFAPKAASLNVPLRKLPPHPATELTQNVPL